MADKMGKGRNLPEFEQKNQHYYERNITEGQQFLDFEGQKEYKGSSADLSEKGPAGDPDGQLPSNNGPSVHSPIPGTESREVSADGDSRNDDVETGYNWSELGLCGKVRRVGKATVKIVTLLILLYLFICSLGFLSSAFRLLGGKTAGSVFTESELLSNPVTGLMIGILATVLVQSSSTSTSIVVTMVASGILDVKTAVPIIMGANIGTSVTNTIVSMAQSGEREEFRRAFAGATVHDMFNWLSVFVLLPLEALTGYLQKVTALIIGNCDLSSWKGGKQQLLKVITKPFTSLVVQINKKVIEKIAAGGKGYENESILKVYCKYDETERAITPNKTAVVINGTAVNVTVETQKIPTEKCFSLFSQLDLGDTATGIILVVFSIMMLCVCLICTVKLLHSMMRGPIAKVIKKTVNAEFPGVFRHLTGYVTILIGAILTILVQSSSIFTSTLTPLVGMDLIKIERMYPLTLGSNIGTTMTGVLAACAASGNKIDVALQIALCHLFFNITGIILFYPVPQMRKLPIKAAKFLGKTTAQYRWFAIVYLILMFVVLPTSVFVLSFADKILFICVLAFVGLLVVFIVVVNVMQRKCQKILPKFLQTWEHFPEFMRSLAPYDKVITKLLSIFRRGPCCSDDRPKSKPSRQEDAQASLLSSAASSTANSTVELIRSNTSPSLKKYGNELDITCLSRTPSIKIVDITKICFGEAAESLLPNSAQSTSVNFDTNSNSLENIV